MKKFTSILIAPIMFLMVMSVSSCKKYDEGPGFSLSSKKARVVNNWKMTKYEMDGEDYTDDIKLLVGGDITYEFTKEGGYSAFAGSQLADKGKWEFTDGKETITLTSDDASGKDVWTIVKLKKDELWIKFTDDDGLNEVQFETK